MHQNNIDFTKIDIQDIEAQHFATFLNFNTIPILVVKEGKNITIINGDQDIIDSYETSSNDTVEIEDSVSIDTSFKAVEEAGCGFTNLNSLGTDKESDCTKE